MHEIEQLLNEIGVVYPKQVAKEVDNDWREYYDTVMAKGYFNDPRDTNGQVPF